MTNKLYIFIPEKDLNNTTYIPHPELSKLLKKHLKDRLNILEKKLSEINLEENDVFINEIKHHSLNSTEPMRANMFLNRNTSRDLRDKENKVLKKISEFLI